jgi:site-specific recombinase XerD
MDAEVMKRQFLEYIEIERGRSVKTIENYDRYLSRYFNQMKIKRVADISEENVREFRLWLNRQPGVANDTMKRRTQNYYLIALRAFLKFLAEARHRVHLTRTHRACEIAGALARFDYVSGIESAFEGGR